MNEDFFQNISSTGNPIEYADSVQRYQTQLPLGISWPTITGSLNPGDLYTDDTSLYMYYPSGVNKTAVAIQQRDRYGGITFTLVSGSTNLYIQASEYFADPNPAFISSPYTVSGEGGTNLISASYLSDTPENPQNYWINLPNPGTYKVVFPNPVVSTAFSVTHSGSSPYVFSQMLPRKSVGSYDIDVNSIRAYHVTASFIDAVAIQVSDSIVVGPDLIGAKSIDGSKIIDGTLSGVLIQNGTVTGNKILAGTISGSLIQAGTITANKLNVTQLDAVAANMGTLVVNSGISIGTNGTIWAGAGAVDSPQTGLKIYTTSGVSRLTTYANGGEVQVDIASNGKLLAGAGAVVLDHAGLTAGKTVVNSSGITIGDLTSLLNNNDALKIMVSGEADNNGGISFYNGAYSAVSPQAAITTDATNNFVIQNNVPNGNLIIGNAATGNNNIYLYNSNVNIMPTSPSFDPGSVDGYGRNAGSAELLRYHLGLDGLLFRTNAGHNKIVVDGATGAITTDGKITTAEMGYLTVRRTATLAITTAGTTIVWQSVTRSANITVSSDTITIANAGYYMFSATFATVANLTSLRMTLTRGSINYVSTVERDGLNTGGGYIFNFSTGFFATAGSTYKIVLTPSANTTLNFNGEGFAGPTPILNIFQSIGV